MSVTKYASEQFVSNKVKDAVNEATNNMGAVDLEKSTTVALISNGQKSAFKYLLNDRLRGKYTVKQLPSMYWYIYDETGTRINYYNLGSAPWMLEFLDDETKVVLNIYCRSGFVKQITYNIAENKFDSEVVLSYSKEQIIYKFTGEEYSDLETTNKTLIGAINELHSMFGSYVDEVAQLIGGDA